MLTSVQEIRSFYCAVRVKCLKPLVGILESPAFRKTWCGMKNGGEHLEIGTFFDPCVWAGAGCSGRGWAQSKDIDFAAPPSPQQESRSWGLGVGRTRKSSWAACPPPFAVGRFRGRYQRHGARQARF